MVFLRSWLRALIAMAGFFSTAALAQTFTNGSFEVPAISTNSFRALNPGDSWLPGWYAGGPNGTVIVQNGIVGFYESSILFGLGPAQGTQWALFPNETLGGTLSQTFGATVGSYCTVNFVSACAYNANDPLLDVTIQASDGSILTNNTYPVAFRAWEGTNISFITTTPATTLTFADASPTNQGAYIGVDAVTLTVEPPGWPYTILNPSSVTNAAGTEVSLAAQAGGNPSAVQWYFGTNEIAGATNPTLNFTASLSAQGFYTAVFSNSAGINSTTPIYLTVLGVIAQPQSQTVGPGSAFTLFASASVVSSVQWFFGPDPIPSATSPNLQLTADNQTAGVYTAQFTSGTNIVTSSPAGITVNTIPFTNGSFEIATPPITSNNYEIATNGATWLAGWNFSGTNDEIFVFNGPFLGIAPVSGNQWVVFDSENSPPPGLLEQTFSTIPGENYSVSFASIAIYYDYDAPKSLLVTASVPGGGILASNLVSPAADWTTNALDFTATSVNTTLSFIDASAPNYGPSVGLDAVTVSGLNLAVAPVLPLGAPGLLVLQVSGPAGRTNILQTSTNLINWRSVSTNVLGNSPLRLTNSVPTNNAAEFWRAFLHY